VFIGCDDPLEAVLFLLLVEMIKSQDNGTHSCEKTDNGNPEDGALSLKYRT